MNRKSITFLLIWSYINLIFWIFRIKNFTKKSFTFEKHKRIIMTVLKQISLNSF